MEIATDKHISAKKAALVKKALKSPNFGLEMYLLMANPKLSLEAVTDWCAH